MTTTPDKTPSPQVPPAPRKSFLSRFLALDGRWRWGLIIVGLLLAIGGTILIYNITSRYQSIQGTINIQGSGQVLNVSSSTVSPVFFVVGLDDRSLGINPQDFSPTPTLADLSLGTKATFIYRSDKTDPRLGDAVQITVFDSNGQNPRVFTTAEYTQTNWGRGIGTTMLIVGLVLAAFAFIMPIIRARLGKNQKQTTPNFAP